MLPLLNVQYGGGGGWPFGNDGVGLLFVLKYGLMKACAECIDDGGGL